jgi:hypothetical protein
MPLFNFATYANYREEWAIEAKDLEHARELVGTNPDGSWLGRARLLHADPVEYRDEFVTEDDVTPIVKEITPGHWWYRAAHRQLIEQSLRQNTAAISGDFHTHRLYAAFYDAFGKLINGFTGNYEICIGMAEALTEWEIANGLNMAYENHGVTWIEVVEGFVDGVIVNAVNTGLIPDFGTVIKGLQVLQPPWGS